MSNRSVTVIIDILDSFINNFSLLIIVTLMFLKMIIITICADANVTA